MKFTTQTLLIEEYASVIRRLKNEKTPFKECLEIAANLHSPNGGANVEELSLMGCEIQWDQKNRPFFNVYPSVLKCLKNTNLNICLSQIPRSIVHEIGAMMIRFPQESIHSFYNIQSVLVVIGDCAILGKSKTVNAICIMRHTKDAVYSSTIEESQLFSDNTCRPSTQFEVNCSPTEKELNKEINIELRRIVVGVLMLAADPKFIEPVFLNRDKNRDGIDIEKAVDRARRNGVFGFDIGRGIEMSPHFRRPHFAIRWTGKGSTVPRLVPVTGAVIHKTLLTEIPSGYEGSKSNDN